MRHLFKDHPESVGETYFEHLGVALYFSGRMIFAGFACLIHAFLPFLFTKTGKCTIIDLHERVVTHRHKCHRTGESAPIEAAE